MTGTLVYLIGSPGVGKSTLMAELTSGCLRVSLDRPVPHARLIVADEVVALEIGRRRDNFSGTDALAMNISPRACEWARAGFRGGGGFTADLAGVLPPGTDWPDVRLVLAEGDRLAHGGFLDSADAGGYPPTLVHLTADQVTLDQRCAARASNQSLAWRRSRATKAMNLARIADEIGMRVITLDARMTPNALALSLREMVPALDVLEVDHARTVD